MIKMPIYMDNHATTRIDPRVLEEMLPYFTDKFGNAGSRHSFGLEAKEAVERSRVKIASLIGAASREIIFTSGATESNNLAIKGVAAAHKNRKSHVITTVTEHKAVLDPCKRLEQQGFQITRLPVDQFGRISAKQVEEALTDNTLLVSVMVANNEIGTLQPIKDIGHLCKEHGVIFHTDAVQALGKVPISVDELCIDLLSLSAHKIYGPKGVGALYIRRTDPRLLIEPMIEGGGQEGSLRSGTLAVPSIVGLGEACELCGIEMPEESAYLRRLRDRLHQGITARLEGVILNGHSTERLPGSLSLSFPHVEGGSLAMSMSVKGVAVSSGSACNSSNVAPSFVLKALGLSDELAQSTIRFGIGRFNTELEVDYVIEEVVRTIRRLRAINPWHAATSTKVT